MTPIGFPTSFQTESIALGNGNITSATVLIVDSMLSDLNGFLYFLSNDGGSNFESAERNVEHTFTTVGDDLRLQILGNPGETIEVKTSSGKYIPIKVSYV